MSQNSLHLSNSSARDTSINLTESLYKLSQNDKPSTFNQINATLKKRYIYSRRENTAIL